jgi:predicted N-acetyltransferase YhbS
MDDREFMAEFELAAIPRERWTHRAHVRTAFLYLRALPFQQALARLRSGIKALNHANSVADTPTGGYHETLTVAWARVVAAALASADPAQDFDSFAQQHADLLRKDLLRQYYSIERVFSPEARAAFVEPDLAPLPQSGTVVRAETLADHDAVRGIHREAFRRDGEAGLVDRLRAEGGPCVSMVATVDGRVVAHALFSQAHLEAGADVFRIGALGPVGVLGAFRRRGIAAALIREGLDRCWQLGWPLVIVLGNPAYYARFGFMRADAWAIRCEFDVPAEAFMLAHAGTPIHGPGVAKYHPAFADM